VVLPGTGEIGAIVEMPFYQLSRVATSVFRKLRSERPSRPPPCLAETRLRGSVACSGTPPSWVR